MSGSIATRLITVLVTCTALILGVGLAIDYTLSRDEILQRLQVESRDTVEATIIDLENLLDGVEASTGLLGRVLAQRDYSLTGLRQLLRDSVEYNDDVFGATIALHPGQVASETGFAPYVFKRDGILQYATLTDDEPPYWEHPWYADAIEAGRPVWSEPYFDRGGGEVWMTTYSVPVYRFDDEGQPFPYAVVTADITLEELNEYLRRLRPGKTGFGVLLSREGKVLSARDGAATPHSVREVFGRARDPERWEENYQALQEGQDIVRDIECPQGDGQCTLRVRALQSTGWPVGVIYSESEILAPLHDYEIKTVLIALATLLLAALSVYAVTRRLLAPLGDLAAATDGIARGELDAPLPAPRGEDEVARLLRAFGTMKSDLKGYLAELERETADRARIEGELDAAREIQMSMLPGGGQARELFAPVELWAGLRPAKTVGGDLYTYLLRDNRLLFAVGDVSDKGVPAALFMARAHGLLQQAMAGTGGPAAAMGELNDTLVEGNDNCMFLTLFLGELDCRTLSLRSVCGGHPAPCLLRDGEVRPMAQEGGPALGLAQGLEFPENTCTLQPGDRLVVYTDGIDEAFSPDRRMFGLDGLLDNVAGSAAAGIAEAGAGLIRAVDEHTGPAGQSDDITLLLLQVGAQEGGEVTAHFEAGPSLASRSLAWLRETLPGVVGDPRLCGDLELVCEEIVTNIEKYAGLPPGGGVDIALGVSAGTATLEVRDDGAAFDPLKQSERAARGSGIASAAVGGLGVHLITQLTDRQDYRREGNRNVLHLSRDLREDLSSNQSRAGERDSMELRTSVTVDEENSVARVSLDGALNTDTAPAFEQRLDDVVDAGHKLIVLDMKDLEYISSAGLRVIFKAAKQTASEGRRLAAANRKPHIDKVFEILKALPDMAVFANDNELDDYLTAMQEQARE